MKRRSAAEKRRLTETEMSTQVVEHLGTANKKKIK